MWRQRAVRIGLKAVSRVRIGTVGRSAETIRSAKVAGLLLFGPAGDIAAQRVVKIGIKILARYAHMPLLKLWPVNGANEIRFRPPRALYRNG
jgi:hypothetical protein